MLHDLQGLGSLTKIWCSFSDAWDTCLAQFKQNTLYGDEEGLLTIPEGRMYESCIVIDIPVFQEGARTPVFYVQTVSTCFDHYVHSSPNHL